MPVWCTNRSLLWSSGVMKPKPFSSLNHFTVPVAIRSLPGGMCGRYAGGAGATTTNAGTAWPDTRPAPIPGSLAARAPERLADHLARRFVVAQAEEARVAQAAVAGPFG